MKKLKKVLISTLLVSSAILVTSCSSGNGREVVNAEISRETNGDIGESSNELKTVEITDVYGTVTVPINPEVVVALDSRTFETLSDWGIELAAVPKVVMSDNSPYIEDESILDIGDHREPNLEIIASVDPDLVIIGQRFESYYNDIKALVPNAVVIDINIDLSESANSPGTNFVNGFIDNTKKLGLIFDKNEEADLLIREFEKSIEAVNNAYNGTDVIMSVIVSGGNIGFSAPIYGRVWGPMYDIFNWVPALGVEGSTTNHQGDEISIEAIAQSNPTWLFVLDRDAGVSTADSMPAQDVIENSQALQNITAVIDGNILYAPSDTYANESIQTYIKLFNNIAEALVE